MATVTGYTAARMKEIEDSAVVDAAVVGDNLILEPHGFATDPTGYPKIDAGNVRGPVGPQGPIGEVTEAELAAGLAATRVPAGAIMMWGGTAAPATWGLCDGGESNRTTEAALFAAIGTTYGVGNGTTTFNRPNFQSKFPAGKGAATWSDALNEQGGNKDAILAEHSHSTPNHQHSTPAHQHSIASHGHDITHTHSVDIVPTGTPHTHTGTTNTDGAHDHFYDYIIGTGHSSHLMMQEGVGPNSLPVIAGSDLLSWGSQPGSQGETHAHNFTTNEGGGGYLHDHSVVVGNNSAGAGGSGSLVTASGEGAGTTPSGGGATTPTIGTPVTNANLPPYITVNFIIKF